MGSERDIEDEDTVLRKSSLKGPWIPKNEWIKIY